MDPEILTVKRLRAMSQPMHPLAQFILIMSFTAFILYLT